MCGRFTLRTPAAILKDYFGLAELPTLTPRYNIAPSQPVGIVRTESADRRWRTARWGLVPAWADDERIGNRMINARAETVASKPAFRDAYVERRCVIPADGFYEWQRSPGGARQPYYMTLADESPFGFAALWERWRDRASGEVVESCALLTTEPNELLRPIHDRMPVLLHQDAVAEWLRPEAAPAALAVLLQPFPAGLMRARAVGTHVNRPANDDPQCIAPASEAPGAMRLF